MAETKAQRFARCFHSAEFVEFTQRQPCSVGGCTFGPIECAHNPSRGAGGTWEDISPLCSFHHRMQHTVGVETFQRKLYVDLRETNAAHAERWRLRQEGLAE